MLGAPVQSFAYPYARYDDRSRVSGGQHFACACADTLSLVTASSNPHALNRVDVFYSRGDWLSHLSATRWFPRYVWTRHALRRMRRALRLRQEAL